MLPDQDGSTSEVPRAAWAVREGKLLEEARTGRSRTEEVPAQGISKIKLWVCERENDDL